MKFCAHKSIPLVFLLSLVFMTSCKKVTITTTLNSDASFQRIISVSGDSMGVDDTVYPFPQDGSWDMTSHKEDSSDSYTWFIRKDFNQSISILAKRENRLYNPILADPF